jgi:hypothetical protein
MNTTIQIIENKIQTKKKSENEFYKELKAGWEWYERSEKIKELKEYEKAYKEEFDKNSFNAQMIESLIYLLKK